MQSISKNVNGDYSIYFIFMRVGLLLLLSIWHFALYRSNPNQKANLYFFIYAFFLSISEILMALASRHPQLVVTKMVFLSISLLSIYIGTLFLLVAVYKIFRFKFKFFFWAVAFITFFSLLSFGFYNPYSFWMANLFVIPPLIEIIRVTLLATRAKHRGATILISGAINWAIFFILFDLFAFGYIPAGPNWLWGHLVFNISWMSLPVAISIYLALESSYASRTLTEKLVEVQQLSAEKQQILASQKEELEKRVEQRTTELKHSLQELKSTQTQLIQSEKMASLGELTAGIAHEIQNPLNFVNNFSETNTELLQEAETEFKSGNNNEGLFLLADIKKNEQKIAHHGKRAEAIVKSMLEHSRSTKGEKQLTDLNALCDEYLRLAYHGFRAKDKTFNATIETRLDDSIGKVNLVPQDIGRVLLNLFNNAFWAVNEKKKQVEQTYEPTVSVSSKSASDRIEIIVSDNGNGIYKQIIDKVFQPFFTTKSTGQGTGLGLSLSYDIIKAHGGELKVESIEGEGAIFIIQFPANKTVLHMS
jgi:signal transduction histidine kinase